MTLLDDYAVTEVLSHGAHVRVTRGRTAHGDAWVVKSAQPSAPDSVRARLRNEATALQQLTQARAPHVLRWVASDTALVSLDCGGDALSHWQMRRPLPVLEVLQVGLAVSRALEAVHQAGWVHKNINPSNIVYAPDSQTVELIDFGMAVRTGRELQAVAHPRAMTGTPAYASPEQTGYTQHALDYRSDFYSLGVTLYALLAGEKPFAQTELHTLVHAILTQAPPTVHERMPAVPPMVSQVVAKLMARACEDRYQSAHGLCHDLQHCINGLLDGGHLANFALGQEDMPARFALPQRLVGRAQEMETLQAAYRRVAAGGREILVVQGDAGSGKSTFVRAVQAAMLPQQGLFAVGTCAALHRHVPFYALSQALDSVVHHLLWEPEAALVGWQQRWQRAAGSIGQALVDVVPSARVLLDGVPPLAPLPARHSEHRLLFLLQRCILALAEQRPLVLFVDDVQWADSGTLRVLEAVMRSAGPQVRLLLIVSQRPSPEPESTALQRMLVALQSSTLPMQRLTLGALSPAALQQLLQDATHATTPWVEALAQHVHRQTAGNALFVHVLMQHLSDGGLLHPDRERHAWTWDLQTVEQAAGADTALTLLQHRIAQPPPAQQQVLAALACVAGGCTAEAVQAVVQMELPSVQASLRALADSGLLVPLRRSAHAALQYGVVHDLVAQAAHAVMGPEAVARLQHTVGQQHVQPDHAERWIFAAVTHLQAAQMLLTDDSARAQLAHMHALAAQHAKLAGTYDVAVMHLQHACTLLPGAPPHAMVLQHAECELLAGQLSAGQARLDALLRTCTDAAERLEISICRVEALGAHPSAALAAGHAALQALGYPLPEKPHSGHVLLRLLRVQRALGGRTLASLGDAPWLQTPRMAQVQRVLCAMLAPAAVANPALHALLGVELGLMSVEHGVSATSALGLMRLAVVHTRFNRMAAAQATMQAARRALARVPQSVHASAVELGATAFVDHASRRANDVLQAYARTFQQALEAGAPLEAGRAAALHIMTAGCMSVSQAETLHRLYLPFIQQHQDPTGVLALGIAQQVYRCLQGKTLGPTTLDDDAGYRETDVLALIHSGQAAAAGMTLFVRKVMLCWLHGDHPNGMQAVRDAVACKTFDNATEHELVQFCFFGGLTLLAHMARLRRGRAPRLFTRMFNKLRAVAQLGVQYRGLPALLEAQRLALQQHGWEATLAFAQAATLLEDCDYPCYRAAGLECAGRAAERSGLHAVAAAYLQQAHSQYAQWGAQHKCATLLRDFPRRIGVVKDMAQPEKSSEVHMVGGFAHEMRNALSSAKMTLMHTVPPLPSAAVKRPALLSDNQRLIAQLRERLTQAAPEVQQALNQLQHNHDDLHDSVSAALEGVERGLSITAQVLEYAHVGHVQAGDQTVSLRDVIADVVQGFADAFAHADIACTVSVEDIHIHARREHIDAMVRNLIANARDALQDSPKARHLTVSVQTRAGQVQVRVQDSGPGMHHDIQQRVFEPFFSTKGARGTGLGLGFARKLAHVYGGDIAFHSVPDQGTVFTLSLPGR